MTEQKSDRDWLAAAARLAERGRPLSRPNPAVGAIVVKDGRVVGRGCTQPGGRPHAEAVALAMAGEAARGATLYVTLEPCAHDSPRGPACADLVAAAGVARAVIGCGDPDPRTQGQGLARIAAAGIAVATIDSPACRDSLAGYLTRTRHGRPHVSLKLALSEDCRLTPLQGQWLTGEIARAHVHAWRAKMDAILVGGGTLRADAPRLDVRLPGIEDRSPERWLLTRDSARDGWRAVASPAAIGGTNAQWLMVEGGAATARAFLDAGLADRLMLYRAQLVVGGDGPALPDLAATALADAADWRQTDIRRLGNDTLEVYERSGPLAI
ncbi:bifunctional diaminohydroxyphosphoribosylaminopyrimidine deaminase/5-amino-6-(5-phosphoribosylamino)uracil reductase RibD [Novosphingobium sp. Gsoil 351]|uniref:bifunctional diaminohydroxyphosphoribosylaminopyrimidine deaminase/5-amino-6-(5-phosphoribosylamino)uracil reductase RibD n=1 Tax=Novosphingobium sp. Gsoil 351 TaxID=2675225 RepID=UPI0012B45F73|nr:bifunctional diaminohydroxyphosphoribosylaminopyrimidine deaminase/5-amino-6-(5-phosphoribosylamino)uracil reductase RibD [Novosphingobium sp. Gsoil 351]QGN56150.1 bifunctional diaminohydroxyphosphoribosylaminopyrimidine deaminase/5-amino-6-(5-phosphoribosylamino)uracil reductase RibD [Novosphingobium sp. Gsoil 351]